MGTIVWLGRFQCQFEGRKGDYLCGSFQAGRETVGIAVSTLGVSETIRVAVFPARRDAICMS